MKLLPLLWSCPWTCHVVGDNERISGSSVLSGVESIFSREHIQRVLVFQVYREECSHGPVQESHARPHWPRLSWTASFAAPWRIGREMKTCGCETGLSGLPYGMASLMLCAVLACMKVGIPGTNGVARFAVACVQPQDVIVWGRH